MPQTETEKIRYPPDDKTVTGGHQKRKNAYGQKAFFTKPDQVISTISCTSLAHGT